MMILGINVSGGILQRFTDLVYVLGFVSDFGKIVSLQRVCYTELTRQ